VIQASSNGPQNGHGRAQAGSLISPHRLGGYLPAVYQEDEFAQRLTSGLDDVLAPVFSALDNFEAYLDPRLAPFDFLDWLATWMGLVADETWPVERRRAFVSSASELYRIRGTPRGLAAHVRIFTGGEVEILERGATSWSGSSGAALPGSPGFDFVVRVVVPDPATVDAGRLEALVAAAKPAHLTHRVEIVPPTPVRSKPPAPVAPAGEDGEPPETPPVESEPEAG
jgi:phage tail-like protein